MKNDKVDLLYTDVVKLFFHYLLPSVGGMLGISLYVLGDTMFVGRGLGSNGLTALNISIPIMNVFGGLGLLFGIGGANVLSILRGEKKDQKANVVFTISLVFCLIAGILITFFGLKYLKEFSLFLGATKGVILDMSTEYLRPLIICSTFFVLNTALTVFVRNDNAPKISMIAMLTGTISNVVLDYIFIFIFKWGMFGAGIATALSPIISLCILMTHFISKKHNLYITLPKIRINTVKRIIFNGTSSFIIETMAGIIIFAFNIVILNIKGNIGISAYSIVANLSLFCAAIFNGISQAIQPIVSINYGAKKHNRVYETARLGLYTSLFTGLVFFVIGITFPRQLSSIFISGKNPELIRITIVGIRLYFISFILMGVNTVMTSYLQSIESTKTSSFISMGRSCVFVLIGLLTLPRLYGLNGVWLTLPFAETIAFVLSILLFAECRAILRYSVKKLEVNLPLRY